MRGLREHDGRSFQSYFRVLRGPDYARAAIAISIFSLWHVRAL